MDMSGSAKWTCCVVKLLEFMSKAIKVLLTELVVQCRNILPSAFSHGKRQHIPELTSHSVNKSIILAGTAERVGSETG